MKQKTNWSHLATLVSVFFFWGFVAASNGVFIPFCKSHFQLNQFESQLIDGSFYGAYFFGSLILYILSNLAGIDFLNKIGFKNGIVLGLSISSLGAFCLVFLAGLSNPSFLMVLICLFIVALGFSLQQTAAQPFVIALGSPETASHRLNFAGSLNSIGTLLGPLVISIVLFGDLSKVIDPSFITLHNIQTLYIILGTAFVLIAIYLKIAKLPIVNADYHLEKSPKALIVLILIAIPTFCLIFLNKFFVDHWGVHAREYLISIVFLIIVGLLLYALINAPKHKSGWGAMQHPQLVLGMIAIFVYVGTEVGIQSNLGALLKRSEHGAIDEKYISTFISLYWGSLMIGRWTAAISVFDISKLAKRLLVIFIPYIAFGIILFVNYLRGNDVTKLYIYGVYIAFLVAAFLYAQDRPLQMMGSVAVLGTAAMFLGLVTTGYVSVFAFVSGGLFCSILFPSIFSLGVRGLNNYTSQGSSFLIMMILGGAIFPTLQGAICDLDTTHQAGVWGMSFTHFSYILPFICFIYFIVHTILNRNMLKHIKPQPQH